MQVLTKRIDGNEIGAGFMSAPLLIGGDKDV